MLHEIIIDYYKINGIVIKDIKQLMMDPSVLKNINEYIPPGIYSYKVVDYIYQEGGELPVLFIVEENPGHFVLVEKLEQGLRCVSGGKDGSNYNIKLDGLRIIYFQKQVTENNVQDTYRLLTKMSPRIAYFSSFLLFFTLLSPLYSNIFNTRLVYSDTFNSVFYISLVFVIFLGMEIVIRIFLYHKASIKIQNNNIILSDYYLYLLNNSKCRDISVKIKLLESSINSIWNGVPLVLMDSVILLVFTICIIFMLGNYGFILLLYYVIFSILCIKVRFDNYSNNYAGLEYSVEKMSVLHILELNKIEARLVFPTSLSNYMKRKIMRDENNKLKINDNNHYWDELIKANSFLSMIIMFSVCYFAVSEGVIGIGSIIAVMIINSRLSASVTSLITRVFTLRIFRDHAVKSLSVIYKEKYITEGYYLNEIKDIKLEDYISNFVAVRPGKGINMDFIPGDVIGILGPSGSGKTTFLKSLSGADFDYSGEITISSVSAKKLSQNFFSENIAYYAAQSCFFKGNLRDNFNLYGITENGDFARIIKKAKINIDSSMLDQVEANELPLSNGQKQKLKLLMIFESKKKIILLDEPTCFMSTDDSFQLLSELISSHRDAIIFIATHDVCLLNIMTKKIWTGAIPELSNPSRINVGTI